MAIRKPEFKKPYNELLKQKAFKSEFMLVEPLLKRKRVCVDIGAHIGVYALEYAKKFETVYSFEPVSYLYEMLSHNVSQQDNVFPMNCAITDREREVHIFTNKSQTEINVIKSPETDSFTENFFDATTEIESIKGRSIDSFRIENIDLIKIDTEGYNIPVLEGMRETLEEQNPIVQIEVPARISKETETFMRMLNYVEVHRLGEDRIYKKEWK